MSERIEEIREREDMDVYGWDDEKLAFNLGAHAGKQVGLVADLCMEARERLLEYADRVERLEEALEEIDRRATEAFTGCVNDSRSELLNKLNDLHREVREALDHTEQGGADDGE